MDDRQDMGASQATGLGSAEAPEPHSGLGPTGAIPSAAEIVPMLSLAQREAILALGQSPSRLGTRSGRETSLRLAAIKTCPYPLFEKTWGGDAYRYNLTEAGLSVRLELVWQPLSGPMEAVQ